MNRFLPLTLLALFLTAPSALAAEELADWQLYPLPNDPVTEAPLAEVEAPVERVHDERQFLFEDEASADRFDATPGDFVPAVDAALVAAQSPTYPLGTCPVTGEALGSMGEPVEALAGHRLVKLCCGGCRGKLDADPAAAVEKVDEAIIAKQKPDYAMQTCPVTGAKLGSMGEPVDRVVGGTLVRLCCPGCDAMLAANPAKYLQKLNEAQGS